MADRSTYRTVNAALLVGWLLLAAVVLTLTAQHADRSAVAGGPAVSAPSTDGPSRAPATPAVVMVGTGHEPPVFKWIQALSFAAAVAAAVFAVWKHFDETREKRRWEKAKFAKQMLDQLSDNPQAMDAACMVGAWEGRSYCVDAASRHFQVSHHDLQQVLEPDFVPGTRNETYVRECFDHLLYHVEQCVVAAEQDLVEWKQIEPMLVTFFAGTRPSLTDLLVKFSRHMKYERASTAIPALIGAGGHA